MIPLTIIIWMVCISLFLAARRDHKRTIQELAKTERAKGTDVKWISY